MKASPEVSIEQKKPFNDRFLSLLEERILKRDGNSGKKLMNFRTCCVKI